MEEPSKAPALGVVGTSKGAVLIEVSPVALPSELNNAIAGSGPEVFKRRPGIEPVGRPEDLITNIGEAVDAITSDIVDRLSQAGPSEFTIELKLGLAGEARIPFIASGKADGAVTVKLTWKAST